MMQPKASYYNELMATPEFIVSYPNLGARVLNAYRGNLEFVTEALVNKDSPAYSQWLQTMDEIKAKADEMFKGKPYDNYFSFRDCDRYLRQDGRTLAEANPQVANHVCMKLTNRKDASIFVVGEDNRPIDAADANVIYGGVIAVAKVEICIYESARGRGVTSTLLLVKKKRDAEKLGGGRVYTESELLKGI